MKSDISKIQNIIFDLGAVLLNINPMNSIRAFEQLGFRADCPPENIIEHYPFFSQFETGLISEEQFIENVRQLINNDISDSQICDAWSKMLLDFPLQRVQILQQLHKSYRLFLYSNTNSIHATYFEQRFMNDHNFPMHSLFDEIYYSHTLGYRKPSKDGFVKILEEQSIEPCETLFVDDLQQNIDIANSIGILTVKIDPTIGLTASSLHRWLMK